jgi:Uma2 family endonuclease
MISSLREIITESEITLAEDPEERFITSGVSWDSYEALLVKLADRSQYRIVYLSGVLEIVSPSIRHEKVKKNLAMLLEHFFYRQRINCIPMGSTTFRDRAKQVGAEPDECYCIGVEKSIPDLAIEVNITSGSIDKLETYGRLGIVEVWLWKNNELSLYHLRELADAPSERLRQRFSDTYGYEYIVTSELLPELDVELLSRCALITNSLQCLDEFNRGSRS